MTPEEALSREKPKVGHSHIFGCLTYSHVPKERRTKLEPIAEKSIFEESLVRRDVKSKEERVFWRSWELD